MGDSSTSRTSSYLFRSPAKCRSVSYHFNSSSSPAPGSTIDIQYAPKPVQSTAGSSLPKLKKGWKGVLESELAVTPRLPLVRPVNKGLEPRAARDKLSRSGELRDRRHCESLWGGCGKKRSRLNWVGSEEGAVGAIGSRFASCAGFRKIVLGVITSMEIR